MIPSVTLNGISLDIEGRSMADIQLRRGQTASAGLSVWERLALNGLSASSRVLELAAFQGLRPDRRGPAAGGAATPYRSEARRRLRFPLSVRRRLLEPAAGPDVVYEPEMLSIFQTIRDQDYSFVDCGANFGYWSVLVTGARLGRHPAIAVEASARKSRNWSATRPATAGGSRSRTPRLPTSTAVS